MADIPISDLGVVTSAGSNDFIIINKENSDTKRISAVNLGSSIGGSRSFMINFPDDPGFKFQPPDNNFYIGGPINQVTGKRGQFVETTDLYDIFSGVTPITITMPVGTDSAVVTLTYTVSMTPCPTSNEYGTLGYANFGYTLECSSNKTQPRWSPGGGANNRFGVGARLYGPVFPWDAYNSIDASVRDQRSASSKQHVSRSMRIYFDESTADSETTLTFSINANVFRMRACSAAMSTGKIAIHPYKDDELDDFGRSIVTAMTGLTEDEDMDTIGIDANYDDATAVFFGKELRTQMNYISNAIKETLQHDPNLDAAAPGVLNQALQDIFLLKQRTGQPIKDYIDELNRIKDTASPYVAFRFDFEPTTLKEYF